MGETKPEYGICVRHPTLGWVRALGCPPEYDTAPLVEALSDAVRAIASLDAEVLGVATVERDGEFSVYFVRDELLTKARAALSRVSPQQEDAQAEESKDHPQEKNSAS